MEVHHDSEGAFVNPRELGGVHNFDSTGTRLLNFMTYLEGTMASRYAEKYGAGYEMPMFDFFAKCGEALSKGEALRHTWSPQELADRITLYQQVYDLFTATGEQEREDLGYVIKVASFLKDQAGASPQ